MGEEHRREVGDDTPDSYGPLAKDRTDARRGEEAWYQGEASGALQAGHGRDTLRPEDWVPVEGSPERVWVWLDVPQEVPAVGKGGSLRAGVGEAPRRV